MQLSFIIINYNTRQSLEKCIASVLKKVTNTKFELIIVNNERQKISEIQEKFKNIANLDVIEVSKNVGFGRACNIGAKKAQGELLCFLNPDAEIVSENIHDLIREIKSDLKIGVVGPRIIEENGNIQPWSVGREPGLLDLFRNNLGFLNSKKKWEYPNKQDVDWVTGAALFSRREVFEAVNGFDEKFFLYFEDVDLCKRVRLLGKKIVHFPDFQVMHFGGKSMSSKKKQKDCYYASQDYYFQKHFGRFVSYLVKICRKIQSWFMFVANKEK